MNIHVPNPFDSEDVVVTITDAAGHFFVADTTEITRRHVTLTFNSQPRSFLRVIVTGQHGRLRWDWTP